MLCEIILWEKQAHFWVHFQVILTLCCVLEWHLLNLEDWLGSMGIGHTVQARTHDVEKGADPLLVSWGHAPLMNLGWRVPSTKAAWGFSSAYFFCLFFATFIRKWALPSPFFITLDPYWVIHLSHFRHLRHKAVRCGWILVQTLHTQK